MNLGQALNTSAAERFIHPQANPTVRPDKENSYGNPQPKPFSFRQEQPRPDGRSENVYQQNYMYQQQQQQQQQKNLQQYQQLQQNLMNQNQLQQRPRLPSNGVRLQFSPVQSSQSNIQRHQGPPYEGSRPQMLQVRWQGPQQHSNQGVIPLNQPNVQNYQGADLPRIQGDQIQGNFQSAPESYRTPFPSGTPVNLTKKTSELEMKPPNDSSNNQRPNAPVRKPSLANQPENISDSKLLDNKPDLPKSQIQSATDPQYVTSKGSKEMFTPDTKIKGNDQKENKRNFIKDETIIRGTVRKNIKFFEKNDTKTNTTLKPQTKTPTKPEKPANVPREVIKSNTRSDQYESGVDETPVIHPNLGSIYQVPRKVAKIPYSKTGRYSKKLNTKRSSKEHLNKNQIYEAPNLTEFLKTGQFYLPYKSGLRKTQKMKTYGSNEELLAFFESTKSWRKLKRYDSKADQKDKVHRPTTNGDILTPKKTPSKLHTPSKKSTPVSPARTPLKSPGTPGTPGPKSLPKTPDSPAPTTPLIKKVPMNKIQVGAAPSPNLKTIKSKVGSLANTTHKPGGGNVKIESHKLDLGNIQPRTEAKNDQYKPSGGEKKIQQVKLQWSAKSKIGSLENATYKPGGGDKKIETVKLDFKEKAKPKVGSKDNVKHIPGGGNIKIENQKLEFKAQSKVGSLDNVKHKPGGGDIKIFDDKTYLRQISATSSEGRASGTQAQSFSMVQEVQGSVSGTPGKNTSVKLKTLKTETSEAPNIKIVTEGTLTSQTQKTTGSLKKKQVTVPKITSTKPKENENSGRIIKLPANTDDAPLCKQRLNAVNLFNDAETGKQSNKSENIFEFNKNSAGKKGSGSPNLPDGKLLRDDSGMSKFMQDQALMHEKVEEIWQGGYIEDKKSSTIKNQPLEEQQKSQNKSFKFGIYDSGNNQQFLNQSIKSPNNNTKIEAHLTQKEEGSTDILPNENMQHYRSPQSTILRQGQQHQQMDSSSYFST